MGVIVFNTPFWIISWKMITVFEMNFTQLSIFMSCLSSVIICAPLEPKEAPSYEAHTSPVEDPGFSSVSREGSLTNVDPLGSRLGENTAQAQQAGPGRQPNPGDRQGWYGNTYYPNNGGWGGYGYGYPGYGYSGYGYNGYPGYNSYPNYGGYGGYYGYPSYGSGYGGYYGYPGYGYRDPYGNNANGVTQQ